MELNLIFCGKTFSRIRKGLKISDAANILSEKTGLQRSDFYFSQNGRKILDENEIIFTNVHAGLRLVGGKGGFGSMLRAIGAQIEKTTNREACRDLSGRRLRDINEEKRLKAWLDKQKDRDAEAEEKRRKKLERLMTVPKHHFKDPEYESARTDLTEKVSEAVEEGFKKAALKAAEPIAQKRKANDEPDVKKKKAALWIGDDLSSSSDTDDSSDSSDEDEKDKEKAVQVAN